VGNGVPTSTELFQADYRKALNGKCMIIVRSREFNSGTITLRAKTAG